MSRFVLIALLQIAWTSVASAQTWLDQPGKVGTAVVEIGTARVHLPPGDWTLAATWSRSHAGEMIPLLEQTFLQTERNQVVAVAYVRSNGASSTGKGFLPSGACFRTDVYLNEGENLYPGQYSCLMINHSMLQWEAEPPSLWQATIAKAASFGGLPRPMIYAEFNTASPSRLGFVSVAIFVNPALAGFVTKALPAWAQSEWHKNNASPEHVAFLNKVATWARAYRPVIAASWN